MKNIIFLSFILLASCSTDHQRRLAKTHGDVINTLNPATVYNQQQNGSGLLLNKNPTYKDNASRYMFKHIH